MKGQGAISARTRVFGLVGHPVRHSLSPAMYNALFPRFGIDAVYVAFDGHPDRAGEVAHAVRALGIDGVNLTVPFKEAVLPHLDRTSVAAEQAGAANVVLYEEGVLAGYNTDGEGLVRSLEEEAGGPVLRGVRAIVVGTGGTGRAVASALLERGAARVVMLNRTPDRAEAAVQTLRSRFDGARMVAGALDPPTFAIWAPESTLVVNCTSGAGAQAVARLDPTGLPPGATWVDVNYWMPDPPHQATCASRGVHFHTGHGMLLHQGALAFELFTGHPVQAREINRLLAMPDTPAGPSR